MTSARASGRIVGALKAPQAYTASDEPKVIAGLPMFPVPLPLHGKRDNRLRMTYRGEPCRRCGAAGSCRHREAEAPVPVVVKRDARETSLAKSGGGCYRRRRKDGSGVI